MCQSGDCPCDGGVPGRHRRLKMRTPRTILAALLRGFAFAALVLLTGVGAAQESPALDVAVGAAESDAVEARAEETESGTATYPVGEALAGLEEEIHQVAAGSAIGRIADRILNTPFFSVQGTDLTLLKIIVAVLLLLIGLWVAKRMSTAVRKRLFTRFRVQRSYSLFLEKIVHAILASVFALWALQFAGIPLTIFAFLGGAIAIAAGFGGQELLANFISGIILMTEKPIREGDLIDLEGDYGRVEEIGPRSTRLAMPGNVDLLVPNRQLLESRIINWTLTDRQVRTEVSVGIAYGSDTRLFEKLLRQAVEEHPRVDASPTPDVLFEEFGDNSLAFLVFFWVTVESFLEQRRIKSDIRFRIDELCRENGIVIAFPQRDVHLDTLSPLEVRISKDGAPGA